MNAPRFRTALVLFVLAARPALADWSPPGNDVVVHTRDQDLAAVVPDGAGGAILFFHDERNQVPFQNYSVDVYAQHVRVDGTLAPGWSLDGSEVFRNNSKMTLLRTIPDGAGGAFCTGHLSYDAVGGYGTAAVFNRITKDGPPSPDAFHFLFWSEMGAGGGGLAPDGAGGIYVAAHDAQASCASEDCQLKVYVGRFDGALAAVPGWPVRVAAHTGSQHDPELASDGAQGVFVLWYDERSAYPDLFLQHILPNATKDPAWPADGIQLGALPSFPYTRQLVPDGAGGVYAAWIDFRGGKRELYLQHFGVGGAVAPGWPAAGLLVGTAPGIDVTAFTLDSDGALGALLTWNETPTSGPGAVRALRLGPAGVPVTGWPAGGRVISPVGSTGPWSPAAAPGANAELFIAAYKDGSHRIWRIDGAGADMPGWPVAMELGGPWALAPDPWGGVIASWNVYPGGVSDVRSLRIGPDGAIGSLVAVEPGAQRTTWTLGHAVPNPSNAGTVCLLSLPAPSHASARIVDVRGRLVRTLLDGSVIPAGAHRLAWDGKGSDGTRAAAGIYLLDVRVDGSAQNRRIVRLGASP